MGLAKAVSRVRYDIRYRTERSGRSRGDLRLFSLYAGNIDPRIVDLQAAVFEHLGLRLSQVKYAEADAGWEARYHGHAENIERLLTDTLSPNVIIFDIDCIPTTRTIIDYVYTPIIEAGALVGPIQAASHLLDRRPYASPAALGISKGLYQRLGRPRLTPNEYLDVGAILTRECERRRLPVVMLPVTACVEPRWPLGDPGRLEFGVGTTYADSVFHAFESQNPASQDLFLAKCQEVLGR